MLGSFWSTTFGQPLRAKRLVAAATKSQGLSAVTDAMQNIAGGGPTRIVQNQYVTFDPRQVQDASEVLYDSNNLYYGTLQDYQTTFNSGSVRYWLLPMTPGASVPFCIQSVGRKLLAGIDFFVLKDLFLVFRVDPRLIFQSNGYLIVTGRQTRRSLLEYPLGIHVKGQIKPVIDYCRNNQTPAALQAALVEIAGLACLPSDQTLVGINTYGASDTTYIFNQSVLRANYPHTLLTVGQAYPKGYVIGNAIQIFSGNSADDWWRAVDWRGGISLDPLMATKGLHLVDDLVWAYAAGVDSNGKVHVRFPLAADFWDEQSYWDEVAVKETEQGYYLNSVVGLAVTAGHEDDFANLVAEYQTLNARQAAEGLAQLSPNTSNLVDKQLVNPLDTFFKAILGSRAMVITVDLSMISRAGDVFNFIARQAPFGAAVVLLCYMPDVEETDYSMQLCSDGVATSVVSVTQVTDARSIGTGSQCYDWVNFTTLTY